jgi:8-oxo-dGTP diphosphatase
MPYTYQYPRPAITVDSVVFGLDEAGLAVLLIQRRREPFQGLWALPGGFIELKESLAEAAARELAEETGMTKVALEQLGAVGEPIDRDPRERTITVVYCGLVTRHGQPLRAASDATHLAWHPVAELPRLGFDHEAIIRRAVHWLRDKARRQPIGLGLLPPRFSLAQLQQLYEAILAMPLDGRVLRRELLKSGVLQPWHAAKDRGAARAAKLYRFDRNVYKRLQREGFDLCLGRTSSEKQTKG